jgi:aspartate ammonia-lyase
MRRAIPLFVSGCVSGIEVNVERCLADASGSLALSTALAAIYGYPAASAVAKYAAKHGMSIRDASVASGLVAQADADLLFGDISAFADPLRMERLIAQFRAIKVDTQNHA